MTGIGKILMMIGGIIFIMGFLMQFIKSADFRGILLSIKGIQLFIFQS